MSIIIFDIVYKKKTDNEVFKLPIDSELKQLKLMICGKYRIYDPTKLFIYFKGELINQNDSIKIKDIFKVRKAKIEITEKIIQQKKKENYKYFCKCKNGANFVCDQCDEFLCDSCYKKRKHITHSNKIIKISEYSNFIKKTLQNFAIELDDKILKDEAYQFFQYWNFDMENEIKNINNCYEFIKQELEDIKSMQIDYIMSITDNNKFIHLKEEIDQVMKQYLNIDTNADIDKIFQDKRVLTNNSREILTKYIDLKNILLNYTKTIKDIQTFNQIVMKDIKDKFTNIKKKYGNPFINNNLSSNSINSNSIVINNSNSQNLISNNSQKNIQQNLNNSTIINKNNQMEQSFTNIKDINNNFNNNNNLTIQNNSIQNLTNSTILNNSTLNLNNNNNNQFNHEKLLIKLKEERKMIIFSLNSQSFKEKIYLDRGNFRKETSSESDVIQLNYKNRLYLLSGKNSNKFYFYDYPSNSIYFINNTIYNHYYGAFVYCSKNDTIYLLGGNNQTKCEIFKINNNPKQGEWKNLPPLNEERQEFGAIYFENYIYVFFGFSPKKGINLSSIERININLNDKFEMVYVNEQISLSSISVAKFIEEEDDNEDNENNQKNNFQEEIILLGGFDGTNYLDTSLILNTKEMKIRDCDVQIPNISKHFQFLFHKESSFIELEPNYQLIYDTKNNVHLLTKDSYELFSEAK